MKPQTRKAPLHADDPSTATPVKLVDFPGHPSLRAYRETGYGHTTVAACERDNRTPCSPVLMALCLLHTVACMVKYPRLQVSCLL